MRRWVDFFALFQISDRRVRCSLPESMPCTERASRLEDLHVCVDGVSLVKRIAPSISCTASASHARHRAVPFLAIPFDLTPLQHHRSASVELINPSPSPPPIPCANRPKNPNASLDPYLRLGYFRKRTRRPHSRLLSSATYTWNAVSRRYYKLLLHMHAHLASSPIGVRRYINDPCAAGLFCGRLAAPSLAPDLPAYWRDLQAFIFCRTANGLC